MEDTWENDVDVTISKRSLEFFQNPHVFNFSYRYIDDVLSINNTRFAEFLPLIYPPELEAKETTDTASSASFLDLYLEFDDSGQLSTKIYDKRDDFNFEIINFSKYVQQYTSFSWETTVCVYISK
jgi:hypothetical protein